MCIFPASPRIGGYIPPRSPGSQYPEDGVDKQSVIGGRTTDRAFGTWKKFLNICPYLVGNIMPPMCRRMALSAIVSEEIITYFLNLTTLSSNSMPGAALMPARQGCLISPIAVTRSAGLHEPVRRVPAGKHQMAPGTARRIHELFHFAPFQDARFQSVERLVQHQQIQTFQTLPGPVQCGQGRFPVGGAVFLAPQKALAAGQKIISQQAREDGLFPGTAPAAS